MFCPAFCCLRVYAVMCIYIYVNVVFISLQLFYIKFIQITSYYVIILYYFILHYILFLIYYLLAIYSKVAMVRLNWRGALATRQFLKRALWERLIVEVAIPWNICFNLIYIFFGFMLMSGIDRTRSWLEDFFFLFLLDICFHFLRSDFRVLLLLNCLLWYTLISFFLIFLRFGWNISLTKK